MRVAGAQVARHTHRVRVAVIACALALTGARVANARPAEPPSEAPADPERSELWRNVIEPHADEIDTIMKRVREDISGAERGVSSEYDPLGTRQQALFRDAYGMLRYAHKLSPQNLDVLALLGRTADELGYTRQAIEADTAYLELAPESARGEVAGRLGMIDVRTGKLDDAIRQLRLAQSAVGTPTGNQFQVALAFAMAARGQMTEAIELLVADAGTTPSYSYENTLSSFALAVLYDRDEQRGAAFEVLDHMQSAMQTGYAQTVIQALSIMRFAPAEDRAYFEALLYESAGMYAEARIEWALYAAIPDAAWRARALEHIAALDADRRAAKPKPTPPRRHP